jgi:hypothetical protein
VKKLLPWLALIIAATWIINDPAGAAATIRHLASNLATFIHGL